ncbi:uncharacterized protein METZ01_LOCUS153630 [marine metagenome]|uniref:Uncharacterized protein n=1 Tax=marine metagenome TaxID=408172 RepID=A0A382AGZ1_9ZZZZ
MILVTKFKHIFSDNDDMLGFVNLISWDKHII